MGRKRKGKPAKNMEDYNIEQYDFDLSLLYNEKFYAFSRWRISWESGKDTWLMGVYT